MLITLLCLHLSKLVISKSRKLFKSKNFGKVSNSGTIEKPQILTLNTRKAFASVYLNTYSSIF